MTQFDDDFDSAPPSDDFVHFPIDSDDGGGFLGSMGRPTGWKMGVLIAATVIVFVALLSAAFGNNKSSKSQPAPPTVIADKGGATSANTSDITKVINSGLKAWAAYVSNGKSDDLAKYFDSAGDQYQKLLADKAKTGQFKEEFKDIKVAITSDVSASAVVDATARVTFTAYGNGQKQSFYTLNFVLKKGADGVWRTESVVNA